MKAAHRRHVPCAGAAGDMPIVVACRCGQRFQAGDEHAERVSCPACGQPLTIPATTLLPRSPATGRAPALLHTRLDALIPRRASVVG